MSIVVREPDEYTSVLDSFVTPTPDETSEYTGGADLEEIGPRHAVDCVEHKTVSYDSRGAVMIMRKRSQSSSRGGRT